MRPAAEYSVRNLVEAFDRGELQLPELQRKFVWNEKKGCMLFDSMYRGYPSGSILVWDCGGLDIPTKSVAVERENDNKHGYMLLLDGQQRITWLTSVILGRNLIRGTKELQNKILFNINDPEDEETEEEEDEENNEEKARMDWTKKTFMPWSKELEKQNELFDVRKVLDNEITILHVLERFNLKTNDPRSKLFDERFRALQNINGHIFRAYQLGSGLSYSKVAQIFVRVNSDGVKLKTSDLALAITSTKWPTSIGIFENSKSTAIKSMASISNLVITFATY